MVESQPSKLLVAGSIPVSRSKSFNQLQASLHRIDSSFYASLCKFGRDLAHAGGLGDLSRRQSFGGSSLAAGTN